MNNKHTKHIDTADEDGFVKRCLWALVFVASLLVIQDRLNADAEKFQVEQAAIRAASCN
ncbi:hypothetical protein R2083_08270 [Nitrosomonas sp. Is35]|uniref:hypothetical protein n=1 Tax=Nitrosomonas sp. Is35 TaxID=3080534 RepID=UPI00294B7151|nr:hypothetical protein [Nitrosomonas sp. Is35]MDV6347508.1 hypothetical protein [Nitrosomonas sp. Is35]